jgi:hypothetical protein
MTKAKKLATAKNTLEIKAEDGDDRDVLLAKVALAPGARHATTASNFAASLFNDKHQTPIMASTAALAEKMAAARDGDKAMPSDILSAQAVVLDTMFTELARRSAANMGQYIDAADRYMRLALKAQANCRATLEALAKLHQPREKTVKHVHVNEGGQAIVADHFHQHTGGTKYGQSDEQPSATGTAGERAALPSPDSLGSAVPIASGERLAAVPDARRQRQRRTEGQP